jgi:energy-coupling factor transporter ATP-binding protein EcfA2
MLHASGNILAGNVVCFIAESGSGKSTLAAMMETLGYPTVADDLLPCRQRDGRIAIPVWLDEEVVFRNLALILFLSRDPRTRRVHLDPLSPKICLHLLLHNGFGEAGGSAAWQAQFDVYGMLASRIPAYRLIIPDDLARLESTAKELASLLACEMETVD